MNLASWPIWVLGREGVERKGDKKYASAVTEEWELAGVETATGEKLDQA